MKKPRQQTSARYRNDSTSSHKGFTIVELLVVIVVIAILAAISIVAYRGIQERAKTAAITSAVDQWQKLIMTEIAAGATFPTAGGTAYTACLGRAIADFPAEGGFDEGECFQEMDGGTKVGSFSYNNSFFQNWSNTQPRPYGKLPVTTYKYDASTSFRARGVWITAFSAYNPGTLFLRWVPQIAGECSRGQLVSSVPAGNSSLEGSWCEIRIERR